MTLFSHREAEARNTLPMDIFRPVVHRGIAVRRESFLRAIPPL
jgi:hypothetical protein